MDELWSMDKGKRQNAEFSTPLIIWVAASVSLCITLYFPLSNWVKSSASQGVHGIYSQYEVSHSTPGEEFGSFIVILRPF
jgi:hypothetical protein